METEEGAVPHGPEAESSDIPRGAALSDASYDMQYLTHRTNQPQRRNEKQKQPSRGRVCHFLITPLGDPLRSDQFLYVT